MALIDKKKYNYMEPALQSIQKRFISLNENDMRLNNDILKVILNMITNKMKENDSLFKEMFTTVFYGGSYYDGLKVGKPEEFDLDLLLRLPKNVTYKLQAATNLPGYVTVKILNKQPTLDAMDLKVKFKGFEKLINKNGYLENSKVRAWMEGVVTLALNSFGTVPNYMLNIPKYGNFSVKICKSGPAITLKASGTAEGNPIYLDIDLVPSIVFQQCDWPKAVGIIANPVPNKPTFFIVPKPLKSQYGGTQYWRLSFQEQERCLIDGKAALKPSIKLLKKMRDYLNHKDIASYYIKTVAMHWAQNQQPEFWKNSLSYIFMGLLKEYLRCLETQKITYYWNINFNLIQDLKDQKVSKIVLDLKKVIEEVEQNPQDGWLIGKYLVTPSELQATKSGLI